MKAILNPFRYGRAVSGDQYYDRLAVGESLYRTIAGGAANVVLYAPRRYGKTSLVKNVIDKWSEDGFTCLYFDMMKMDSVERFCEKYAAAVYAAEKGVDRVVRTFGELLSRLRPKFTVGEDGSPSIELDVASRKFTPSDLEDILNLPEKVAKGKRTFVVVFDEFQEIAGLSQSLPMEGVFRGCIQHHESVRYVFLGSKTHLLKRMFSEHSRPFYNSARIMHLEKPPEDESRKFVTDRFSSAGVRIGAEEVDKVLSLSQNIPYFIQALSSEVFESVIARGGRSVRPDDILAAADSLTEMKREQYETVVGELSSAQRSLLSALAASPTNRFDEAYRRKYGIGPSSTVHGALEKLVDKGHVEKTAHGYFVGDPFFARYLTALPYEIVTGK
ncbi:MAG: hypothetical protein IJI54_00500 [Kiritimatiellae bacterium]|nr:hypothetical protein [Kiritimatiellia bacterium]